VLDTEVEPEKEMRKKSVRDECAILLPLKNDSVE
jgi:hypothetical protein